MRRTSHDHLMRQKRSSATNPPAKKKSKRDGPSAKLLAVGTRQKKVVTSSFDSRSVPACIMEVHAFKSRPPTLKGQSIRQDFCLKKPAAPFSTSPNNRDLIGKFHPKTENALAMLISQHGSYRSHKFGWRSACWLACTLDKKKQGRARHWATLKFSHCKDWGHWATRELTATSNPGGSGESNRGSKKYTEVVKKNNGGSKKRGGGFKKNSDGNKNKTTGGSRKNNGGLKKKGVKKEE